MPSASSKNIFIISVTVAGLILFYLFGLQRDSNDLIIQTKEAAILLDNWKLEDAETKLQEITSTENPLDSSLQLYFRTLLLRGNYLKAEALYNRYFNDRSNIPSTVLLDFASVNYYLGKINKADSLCTVILQDSIRSRSLKSVSRVYNIVGLNKFFSAEYDSALFYQQKSLAAARSSNSLKEEADALRQIGVLAWYKGDLDSALQNYYEPALEIYKSINDKHGEATTLSDIGLLYFDWKNWTKEFYYQMKALMIRREIGDLMGIADSYNFLEHFPKLTKELEFLKYELTKKSYDLSKSLGYKWGIEIASNSLQQFIRRNYELFGNFPFNPDSITYSSAEAKLFQLNQKLMIGNKSGMQQEVIKIYEEILRIADSVGYAVIQCNTLSNLANIYLKDNRLGEASEAMERAVQLSQSSAEPKFHFASINILKEKLEFKRGNQKSALRKLKTLAHYYDSLYIAESNLARNGLEWQSSLYSVYNHRNWTYSLLLDLIYETNEYEELLNYSAKERSLLNWHNFTGRFSGNKNNFASLFEKLISLESNDRGDLVIDSLLTLFQILLENENQRLKTISKLTGTTPSFQTVSSFQKKLGKDEIFIEFSEGEEYFYVAGITNEKIIVKRIPLLKDELKSLIIFFRKSIERGRWHPNDNAWEKPAEYLYSLLLEPVLHENEFNDKNAVILSPCNVLHQVPFAALIVTPDTDDDNQKLIDRYSIKYSSSRRDYLDYLENPVINLNSVLAFAPENEELQFSDREISLLPSSLFQKKETFTGKHATKKKFLANAYNFDVIHIASHSNVNLVSPLQSKIKFSDGDLELFDFYQYNINADLVVLSSCESGRSVGSIENIPTSLDMVSFPEALLSAGTKSVLSTLWIVDDYSTSEIISRFYLNMLAQRDKNKLDLSESLSTPLREFISSQKEKRHPFYWAPFIISN